MTVKQVIQEIEALPAEQQRQVFVHFKELSSDVKPGVLYLNREKARPMIKEILSDHADLFRKLAQ